jgi:hypothetical protein
MKKIVNVLRMAFLVTTLSGHIHMSIGQTSPPSFSTSGTFSRTIPEDFLGLNGTNVLTPLEDWNAIDVNSALSGSNMRTLRFPGGTVSNFWDWRRGFFLTDNELPQGFTMPYNNNPPQLPDNLITDFSKSINRIAAAPIFNLNIMSSDYWYQMGLLYAANVHNLPVRYIELGNEFYLTDPNNIFKYPSVINYFDESMNWIQSIKQQAPFSSTEIAIVGSTSNANDPGRRRLWLETLISQLQASQWLYSPDAISLHYYGGSGVNGSVNASNVSTFLSQPFVSFQNLANAELNLIQTSSTGMEVWLTEYNLFNRNSRAHGTWAHGLYTAVQTLTCLNSNAIAKIDYHTMSGNGLFGSIFSNSDGFNFPADWDPPLPANTPSATIPWSFTACGYSLDILDNAINNCNQATAVNISGANDLTSGIPDLYSWYFQGTTSDEIIVINLGNNHYGLPLNTSDCDLSPINASWNANDQFNIRQISGYLMNGMSGALTSNSYPPSNLPLNSSDFSVNEYTGQVAIGAVTFAPYSVTRLWIENNTLIGRITDTEICDNTSTTIRLTGGNTSNYSSSSSAVIQPDPLNEPWLFTFTAPPVINTTVFNLNFSDGNSNIVVSVTVHPTPVLTVSTFPDPLPIAICSGSQIDLSANLLSSQPNPTISYIWTPSHDILAGGNPSNASISVSPVFDTDYQVFASDGFCWVEGPIIPISLALAKLSLGDDLLLCDGQQVELIPVITGNYSLGNLAYNWSTSEITSTIIFTPQPGINTVSLSVTDASTSCSITDEILITTVSCCQNSPLVLQPDGFGQDHIDNTNELDFYLVNNALPPGAAYNAGSFVLDNAILDLNGIIKCNHDFAFTNCILNFSQDAQILLDQGYKLKFQNCTLQVCNTGTTWNGIRASHKNAHLILDNCVIGDAQASVQLSNDASYTLIDNSFSNCFVAMDFENYFDEVNWGDSYTDPFSVNFYNYGYITGNHFSSTGMLGEPFLSENLYRPYTAVNAANVLELYIGRNQSGLENLFHDSHYGIFAKNSSVFCYNNEFDNLFNFDNYHSPWIGTGIYSKSDFDYSDREIIIGNGGIQGTNLFLNSELGIYLHGDLNSTINKNHFGNTDPLNPRQKMFSLFVDFPRNNPIYIANNKFFDFQIGVCGRDVGSYGTGQFIAEWNEFYNAFLGMPNDLYGTAINVDNPLGLNSGLIKINNNTINDPRIGIHCRMAIKPQILDNIITFDIAAANLGDHFNTGIWTEETDFADISRNTITQSNFLNDPAQSVHLIGIASYDMNTSGIWCNQINNMGYSMFLMNDCLGTELHNNHMRNYDVGIWCENLKLKQQGTNSINWENSWLCDNSILFLGNKRVSGTLNQPQPINWYHHGSTTPTNSNCPDPGNPNVVFPIGNADFVLAEPCGTSTERNITEENRDAYFGSSISTGISNPSNSDYLSQNEVYKTLNQDTSLIEVGTNMDPDFDQFYSEIQNTNIEIFKQVKDEVTNYEFSSALLLSNAISENNTIESNHKFVTEKYLQIILYDSLSESDSTFLETLSMSNVSDNGSAVYSANSILLKENIISSYNSNKIHSGYLESKDNVISIYPNPFSDQISIDYGEENVDRVEIYNSETKLIFSSHQVTSINTKHLTAGTYLLKIFSEFDNSHYKFVLVKP